VATSAAPQLALSDAGTNIFTFRTTSLGLAIGSTSPTTYATNTPSQLFISNSGFGTTTLLGLDITGQATSTSNVGYNITSGCYAVNGTCVGNVSGGSGDITSVGDVTSGAAFDGTQGTVLTFNNAGGDGTLTFDGSDLIVDGMGIRTDFPLTANGDATFNAGLTSVEVIDESLTLDGCVSSVGGNLTVVSATACGESSSSKWATTTNLVSIYPAGPITTGVVIGGTATTTGTNLQVIGTTTSNSLSVGSTAIGSNVLKVSPLTGLDISASETTGGMLNAYVNTTDEIAGVFASNHNGSSRTVSIVASGASYTGTALHVRSNGTATTLNVAGHPTGQGLIKAASDGVGDANASIFSSDASTSGFLGQLWFGKCGISSTCWNMRDYNNAQLMTYTGFGNLGFGTTTPQWQVQIATSSKPQLSLSDASLTSNHWTMRNAGGNLYIGTSSPLTFATSSLSALTLDSNGNLLLATGTPWLRSRLNVVGTTTIQGQFASLTASTTASATQTIDWSTGNTQAIMLTAATNIVVNSTSSNPINGGKYTLRICQDPTGSRTLTWANPVNLRWWNGTTTITTTANKCTFIGMIYTELNGNSTYSVVASSTNIDIK
jgi:hypothetical protein